MRAQTERFMQLLKDLRADGSPEAQRLRQALVEVVTSYDASVDKAKARMEVVSRLLGIEAGVADLLMRTVKSLRERLYKEGKRIGTGSQQGKSIRAMSKALDTMAEGLQQMKDAVAEGDQQLRQSAHQRIDEAQKQLQAVGMRG